MSAEYGEMKERVEYKENHEARAQRDISALFDSMISYIRDDGARRNLSEKQIQDNCSEFMENYGQGSINFQDLQAFIAATSPESERKKEKEEVRAGDAKADQEKAELIIEASNKAELDRYKKEIKIFLEEILSSYRCPLAPGIPTMETNDDMPVRIPEHPGGLAQKQQIWVKSYIDQVHLSFLDRVPRCPLTRLVLPRNLSPEGDLQDVKTSDAQKQLFIFLVATQAWFEAIPKEFSAESCEKIHAAVRTEDHKRRIALQEVYKDIKEILDNVKHKDHVKAAKEDLANLKAGRELGYVVDTDKKLLNFLVRTEIDERKIKTEEEQDRKLRMAKNAELKLKAETEQKLREEEIIRTATQKADEAYYKKRIEELKNTHTVFQCPIETTLPDKPVRFRNHPAQEQRRQCYLQRNAIGLAQCPITRANLNGEAAELEPSSGILSLYLVAAQDWIGKLPRAFSDDLSDQSEEIEFVLRTADVNFLYYLETARKIFADLKANRRVSFDGLYQYVYPARDWDQAQIREERDRELLGFLINSIDQENKLKNDMCLQTIARLKAEMKPADREAQARQAAQDLRRKMADDEAEIKRKREQNRRDAAFPGPGYYGAPGPAVYGFGLGMGAGGLPAGMPAAAPVAPAAAPAVPAAAAAAVPVAAPAAAAVPAAPPAASASSGATIYQLMHRRR